MERCWTSLILVCCFVLNDGSESLDLKEMSPTFDSPLANVTVKEGATAVLPCSVRFLGTRQVVWTDQWSTLLTFEDRRIIDDERVSVERPFTKDWNLHIRDVKHKDQGLYNCQINTSPVKIKTVHLTVQVSAKIVDELSSSDVQVREGETVTLVCNVTGIPMPTVTWFRHTKEENGEARQKVGVSGEVLLIHNVSRYCGDTYECVAFNGVPPAVNRMIEVKVHFAPEIYLPNKRIGQEVGKETILECIIAANPQAVSKWTKDGVEMKNKGGKYRIEVYNEDEKSITLSLRILDVSREDFGTYTCEASNKMGGDREEMVLFDYTKYRQSKTTTTTTATPATIPSTSLSTMEAPRRAFASQGLHEHSGAQIRIFTQGPPRTRAPPPGAQQFSPDGDHSFEIGATDHGVKNTPAKFTTVAMVVSGYAFLHFTTTS